MTLGAVVASLGLMVGAVLGARLGVAVTSMEARKTGMLVGKGRGNSVG